jgi:hypothetical protein
MYKITYSPYEDENPYMNLDLIENRKYYKNEPKRFNPIIKVNPEEDYVSDRKIIHFATLDRLNTLRIEVKSCKQRGKGKRK